MERLFNAITPLLRDKDERSSVSALDDEGKEVPLPPLFKEEQALVARTVHLVRADDSDTQLRLFLLMRKYFLLGGPRRLSVTLPPMVFASMALARAVYRKEGAETAPQFSARKIFQFVLEAINSLNTCAPAAALNLYLQAAQV